jgi:hypothetical protein
MIKGPFQTQQLDKKTVRSMAFPQRANALSLASFYDLKVII